MIKKQLTSFLVGIKKRMAPKKEREKNVDAEVVIDNIESVSEENPISPQLRNKADVLTFDKKKRIFIVKKRRYAVALYDPENYKICFIMDGEPLKTVRFEKVTGQYCLPCSGNWYHAEHPDLGLYCPERGAFFLYGTQQKTLQTINKKDYKKNNNKLEPITGDWMGNGKQSIGLFDKTNSIFFIKTLAMGDTEDKVFSFGSPEFEGVPLVGDWDGDGKDSIGLYLAEQGLFFLHNCLDECLTADVSFYFGPKNSGMIPLVGDWNGDGKDTIGLYSPEQGLFFLHNKNEATDKIDYAFHFGPAKQGVIPIVGDWNGEGKTGVGVYDPDTLTFYLTQKLSGGSAQVMLDFSADIHKGLPFVLSYIT